MNFVPITPLRGEHRDLLLWTACTGGRQSATFIELQTECGGGGVNVVITKMPASYAIQL